MTDELKSNVNEETPLRYDDPEVYKEYLDMLHSEEYQRLRDIYSRKTTMDILGVARQENPHSSFIAWLLNPGETHGLNDYPMKKFCETICFAYLKYAKSYLNDKSYESEVVKGKYIFSEKHEWEDEKKHLIKRLLFSEKKDNKKIINCLMNGKFKIKSFEIYREKKTKENVSRRADIWIQFTIEIFEHEEKKLFIFIENKVTSDENESQTIRYINDISSRFMTDNKDSLKDVDYFVPIYLYVANNEEMKQSVNDGLKGNFPCKSRLYLILNYQYLMDGVFAPCLASASEPDIANKLDEYMNCLGKSIDASLDEDNKENNKKNDKKNIVMAVSPREKEIVSKLWDGHKEILIDIGKQMSGTHFAICSENDRQFYMTIFRPIIDKLSDSENVDDVQLADRFRSELNDKKEYWLQSLDGSFREFKAQGGQGNNISALAYYLLRQYLEDNKEKAQPESLDEIRRKLYDKITNKWLSCFFVTEEEAKNMLTLWKSLHDSSGGKVVCSRYKGTEDQRDDCPLSEKGFSIMGKNYLKNKENILSDEEIKMYLLSKTCPFFPDTDNYILRKNHFGSVNAKYDEMLPENYDITGKSDNCKVCERGKGCSCIYDFIHCFNIGGIENIYSDIFDSEKESLKKMGYNDKLPAVEYAEGKKLYIARWWFLQDVYKMIKALWEEEEKCPYLSKNKNDVKNCLKFNMVKMK